METSARRRLQGIVIFMVFLALAVSIWDYQNRGTSRGTQDFFRTSTHEYRDLRFINKAQISFSSNDIIKAQDGIAIIMDRYAKQRIRRQSEGSNGAYLFTVAQSDLQKLVMELREFGTVGAQTEQIDTALVNLDYDGESARLASYERELDDLDKVRLPSDQQNARKEALHRLIQTSRTNLEKLRESENVLLYLTLRASNSRGGMKSRAISFVLLFLKWFLYMSVAVVLIAIGTRLLMHFFRLLGINEPSSGYTYGSYGHYYSDTKGRKQDKDKRKVKRVYKDKGSSDKDNSPDEK